MNKNLALIPLLLLAVLVLSGCGASAERLNNDGNKAFAEQDYAGAALAYRQAQEQSPELAEPHYNAANSHYRQAAYDQAQQEIEQTLVSDEAQEGLDQHTYYNLGNTLYQAQQYQAAIEAYREALRLNPGDLEAKQNLELALRQLQQQQQQQEQQQDQQQQQQDQQQDQQSQDQQSQGQQSQDQQSQGQQSQDQQSQGQPQQDQQQDQQSQDQQSQDQQQDQQSQDQQSQDQQQEGQAGDRPQQVRGLTREQAEQLFEAAAQNIESLEAYLNQMMVFPWAPPAQDW